VNCICVGNLCVLACLPFPFLPILDWLPLYYFWDLRVVFHGCLFVFWPNLLLYMCFLRCFGQNYGFGDLDSLQSGISCSHAFTLFWWSRFKVDPIN
jgi:hypothetical protein